MTEDVVAQTRTDGIMVGDVHLTHDDLTRIILVRKLIGHYKNDGGFMLDAIYKYFGVSKTSVRKWPHCRRHSQSFCECMACQLAAYALMRKKGFL